MKHCPKCDSDKPESAFSWRVRNEVRSTYCKACGNEAAKAWYVENRNRAVKRMRKWKKDNPDKVKAFHRKQYLRRKGNGDPKTYFIQGEQTKLIKIGFTYGNVLDRLGCLQTGSPDKLKILLSLLGHKEKQLHVRFRKAHAHGEWFYPSPALLKFIQENGNKTPSEGV